MPHVDGFRVCFSSLPLDQFGIEHLSGPRLGPFSRAGYEPDWDAAGKPFDRGEPELRVVDVDGAQHSRRAAARTGLDKADVAGAGPQPFEYRALTVDDGLRRTRSEPPQERRTRAELVQALHAHGISPGVDDAMRGRRMKAEPILSEPGRAEAAKRAMKFIDIDCLLRRKHFHDVLLGSNLPPRFAASCLDGFDIDAPFGRRHYILPSTALREGSVLPWASQNYYDWALGPSTATARRQLFEHSRDASRYAMLLGRANANSEQEHIEKDETKGFETLRLWEREQGWQRVGARRRANSIKNTICFEEAKLTLLQARAKKVLSKMSNLSTDHLGEAIQGMDKEIPSSSPTGSTGSVSTAASIGRHAWTGVSMAFGRSLFSDSRGGAADNKITSNASFVTDSASEGHPEVVEDEEADSRSSEDDIGSNEDDNKHPQPNYLSLALHRVVSSMCIGEAEKVLKQGPSMTKQLRALQMAVDARQLNTTAGNAAPRKPWRPSSGPSTATTTPKGSKKVPGMVMCNEAKHPTQLEYAELFGMVLKALADQND
mmetsp:Transcript_113069/g.319965  ORF Transcript_113069/g.319965 Transcript_113069/m.319965 type:complete len:544 (-) Transcript_113069:74-1705(-)